MAIRRDNNIETPNLGLYLGIAPTAVPRRAMKDCLNVRIKQGKVVFDNLGWTGFPVADTPINLDSKPVLLIESFELRDASIATIFGNTTDLFHYDDQLETVSFITERYEDGTATVTNGSASVAGTGTLWLANVKIGDFFSFTAAETDPGAIWYEIASVDSDVLITLTIPYAQVSGLTGPYTIRKTFTGLITNPWFTETFYNGDDLGGPDPIGDRIYFTNRADRVTAWDGLEDQIYTPDLANVETCLDLVRHKNKMVYVGPTIAGELQAYSIRASDIGKPEETVTGEAVELIVKDTPDHLSRGLRLGEQLVLYGEKSITLAQSAPLPLVYAFRAVIDDYGPISPRGIAVYPDFHDFIGADRQYRFNGASALPLNDHVWREVNRVLTPERNGFLHSHFVDELGELMWAVPLTTDLDTQIGATEQVFTTHYMEDVGDRFPQPHTRRELPALTFGGYRRQATLSWDEIQENFEDFNFRWNDKFFFKQFPLTLFGDENGNIFSVNTSTSQSGAPMNSFARFARVAVGNIESNSIIRRIYPYLQAVAESDATVQVRLYGTNSIDGIANLLSDQELSTALDGTKRFVSPRKAARFVEVEIGTIDSLKFWATSGYGIDTVPGSSR